MKGIYIAAIDKNKATEKGVINKIYGQVKAFNNLGINMDCTHIEDRRVYFRNKTIGKKLNKPTNFFFHKYIKEVISKESYKYDFAYIRFSRGDFQYYKLIKYLSKNNIKVIVEIPTYPYRDEYNYKNIKHLIYGISDILIWKIIKKYIYRIAVTNDIKLIEGIECINMYNGIDLESLPVIKNNLEKNVINMVGIANISKWHGYDRVIRGLYQYKQKASCDNIKFYIIGEGNEKQNLMDLTKKLELTDTVKFLGSKTGKDLDKELDNMNIGVSSLALFRAGGGHDPIKTKEFLGRGMPVMLAYDDKLVDMTLPYVINVAEDDSVVDIHSIVNLYVKSNWDKDKIREYANDKLSWESQIEKIIKNLDIKNT